MRPVSLTVMSLDGGRKLGYLVKTHVCAGRTQSKFDFMSEVPNHSDEDSTAFVWQIEVPKNINQVKGQKPLETRQLMHLRREEKPLRSLYVDKNSPPLFP